MNNALRQWITRRRVPLGPVTPSTKALKNNQTPVIDFMRNHDRLLVIHGTGSGKTLTGSHLARDFLNQNPENIVIFVTPKGVQNQFIREATTVLTGHPGVYFTTHKGLTSYLGKNFPTSRELFRKVLRHCMVIVDEAHLIGTNTQESEVFVNVMNSAEKLVLMTGTPMNNGELSELKTYATLMNPGTTPSIKTINDLDQYFRCKVSVYLDLSPANASHYPNLLPKVNYTLNFTPNQAQKFSSLRSAALQRSAWTGGPMAINRSHTAQNKSLMHNRKIFANMFQNNDPKHNAFLRIYRSRQKKTVVFFVEKVGVDRFKNFLTSQGIPFTNISGNTPNKASIIQSHPANSNMIYILSKSGKEGLNFKGVRTVVFMDLPWVPSNYDQVVGRGRRFNSHIDLSKADRNVMVYDLMYKHPTEMTINVRASQLIQSKRTEIGNILTRLKELSIENPLNNCNTSRIHRPRNVTNRGVNRYRIRHNRVVNNASLRNKRAFDPANREREFYLANVNIPTTRALRNTPLRLPFV